MGVWKEEEELKRAQSAYDTAKSENDAWREEQKSAFDRAYEGVGRMRFDYNPYTDNLYLQYKKQQGKRAKNAMRDSMANAATLTGGFGNSYASTVGNAAYHEEMEKADDIIPELWNLAYTQHQSNVSNAYRSLEARRSSFSEEDADRREEEARLLGVASDARDALADKQQGYSDTMKKAALAGLEGEEAALYLSLMGYGEGGADRYLSTLDAIEGEKNWFLDGARLEGDPGRDAIFDALVNSEHFAGGSDYALELAEEIDRWKHEVARNDIDAGSEDELYALLRENGILSPDPEAPFAEELRGAHLSVLADNAAATAAGKRSAGETESLSIAERRELAQLVSNITERNSGDIFDNPEAIDLLMSFEEGSAEAELVSKWLSDPSGMKYLLKNTEGKSGSDESEGVIDDHYTFRKNDVGNWENDTFHAYTPSGESFKLDTVGEVNDTAIEEAMSDVEDGHIVGFENELYLKKDGKVYLIKRGKQDYSNIYNAIYGD